VGLTSVLLLLAAASPASAIRWDVGGAIPPAKTPPATKPDPLCEQSYANDRPRGGPRIRFGIGPSLSGEAGAANATPSVPQNTVKRDAALVKLRGKRYFTVRLNRLFMADGKRGIAKFKKLADHFTRRGLHVELQVRYHPRPADNGDIDKWVRYVRRVIDTFGPNKLVTGFQITNEVNLDFSPNTSDGFYEHAVRALVRGVIAAKRESLRRGYAWQKIGFNYAWRFDAQKDARFWDAVGKIGGARLRRYTDWVGVDIYPGTYVPALSQVVNLGDAFLEGVAQVRECYMRKAGFTRSTPMRIEEIGYPTGPGRPDEAAQARALRELVKTANSYRGTYNIRDLRWFDLRDNNSSGPNFQSYFGLLRDDYTRKSAFGAYRALVARYGAGPGHRGSRPRPKRPTFTG
jgi:hypothetical protein